MNEPMMTLPVVPLPGLDLQVLCAELPSPLGELSSPPWLVALLQPDAAAPLQPDERLRGPVRDLLRGHGYRPTGRGKPSSEYLAAAAAEGRLSSINAVVDVGNAASLHSGLPVSVVDVDCCVLPLAVVVPPPGSSYIFNRSGQTIDVGGLLSLADAQGPCANAVKDAQRTKTSATTTRVLVLVWGTTTPVAGRAGATAAWIGELLQRLGATWRPVPLWVAG